MTWFNNCVGHFVWRSTQIETLRAELFKLSARGSWQPETTTDPEIVEAVQQVVAILQKAGHTLIEASPTFDYEGYFKPWSRSGRSGCMRAWICSRP
jgi:hypothetical protein